LPTEANQPTSAGHGENGLETDGAEVKQLKSMSVEDLLALKAKVEAAISSRVSQERKRLAESMRRLESISNGSLPTAQHGKANGKAKRRRLPAKYRNPANAKETWAGRGMRPRWLVAAIKGGKKLKDFEVGGRAAK
jgi:DNA-binding protein H-NS